MGRALPLRFKKHNQVRDSPWVDIVVGHRLTPIPLARIESEVLRDVLVDFFLKINTNGAVGADDFICANARVRWYVAVRIRQPHISRIIANRVIRSLYGRRGQFIKESLSSC
jgi:hypothetical protein